MELFVTGMHVNVGFPLVSVVWVQYSMSLTKDWLMIFSLQARK